jgi:hypothetical protein
MTEQEAAAVVGQGHMGNPGRDDNGFIRNERVNKSNSSDFGAEKGRSKCLPRPRSSILGHLWPVNFLGKHTFQFIHTLNAQGHSNSRKRKKFQMLNGPTHDPLGHYWRHNSVSGCFRGRNNIIAWKMLSRF